MKLENNKNQTKRRSSPRPKKARAKEEGNPMAQSILETRLIPVSWRKTQISPRSGFLLRPTTSGKMMDNPTGRMLITGREPKPS